MHERKKQSFRSVLDKAVPRREALKGLGALAISLPVLGSASCAEKKGQSTVGNPSTGGAAGNATGSSGASAGASNARGTTGTGTSGTSGATGNQTAGTAGTTGSAAGKGGANGNPAAGSGGATGGPAGASGNPAAGSGGATGGPAGASGNRTAGGGGAGGNPSTGGDDLIPVTWDNVASCTLTPTDPAGEGPFFIHEDEVMNDVSLIRSDMRDGKPGIELQLNLRVLDSGAGCMTPISDVQVYTWHTDATGFYSGFNNQNPDQTYTGGIERTVENSDRFCRGVQVTDKDGIVRFRTVYPGWYDGRAIHIHFVALRPGSGPATTSYRSTQYMVFTTQMYFEEQFSRMIHEHNAPYMTRANGPAYNMYVKPQNMTVNPTMRMQGNVAVGALNIITATTGSRR